MTAAPLDRALYCGRCGRPLPTSNRIGYCRACVWIARPCRTPGCTNRVSATSRSRVCKECR